MDSARTAPQGAAAPPQDAGAKAGARRPPIAVLIVAAVVIIIGLVFGLRYLAFATTHESTDDARVDADTVAVTSKINERVALVLVDTNQRVRRGQILMRLDDQDERTKYDQAIAAVAAQRAQVRAAQANVSLTQEQQAAQSAQGTGGVTAARAQIENASANYSAAAQQSSVARAAIAQANAQLRVAQAQVPSAKAALDRANADFSRYSSLVRTGDIAAQQLDAQRAAQAQAQSNYRAALDNVTAAETAVVQAQARLTGAIASATAAQAGIGAQEGQLATAQGRLSESSASARVPAIQAQADAASAQVGSLNAQAETARNQLSYTVIRSPIDGVVGAKNVEVGATVAPGQALLQIVPEQNVYVTANFKETQLGNIRVGQDVDIEVDAYKGTPFHGQVESINPASQNTFALIPAQNATGNFVKVTQRVPLRIKIVGDRPEDKPLRVGMSVVANVKIK